MRICLTVLNNRPHSHHFSLSLNNLTNEITSRGHEYEVVSLATGIAGNISLLPKGRQDAIKYAKSLDSTHILCIDDDIVCPKNTLEILASRKMQAIGVNYVRKMPSLNWVAVGLDGQQIGSAGKSGIEKVGHIGLGMFLLELRALDGIPAPHFEILWNPAIDDYDSEDTYFCDKLRKGGVEIYVDHDASQTIGHIGEYIYSHNSFKA